MARYSIVGQRHIGLDPYLEGILPGTPVLLVREPTNEYDQNAIQVWIDGKRVGYLPKGDAAKLAPIIRSIAATFARSPNSSYPQVEVEFELGPKA